MPPVISPHPRADLAFVAAVEQCLLEVGDAAELIKRLRARYPDVDVDVHGLSGEPAEGWSIYRDGRPAYGDPDGVKPLPGLICARRAFEGFLDEAERRRTGQAAVDADGDGADLRRPR
jgi:hypothetical protein